MLRGHQLHRKCQGVLSSVWRWTEVHHGDDGRVPIDGRILVYEPVCRLQQRGLPDGVLPTRWAYVEALRRRGWLKCIEAMHDALKRLVHDAIAVDHEIANYLDDYGAGLDDVWNDSLAGVLKHVEKCIDDYQRREDNR